MNTDFQIEPVCSSTGRRPSGLVILTVSDGVWISNLYPCQFVFIRGFLMHGSG